MRRPLLGRGMPRSYKSVLSVLDLLNLCSSSMKIAVASGKGGVGKSMLASALAMLFAQDYQIVAVDCDVDAPNLHLWLGTLRGKAAEEKSQTLGISSESDSGESAALGDLNSAGWDSVEKISTTERPIIDPKKCNSCGKCVEICQFGALKLTDKNAKWKVPNVKRYFCEGCGACEVVCPQKAIKLEPVENAEIRIKKDVHGFPLVSAQLYPGETGSGKIVEEIKSRAEEFRREITILDSPAGTGCPVIAALKDSNFTVLITEPTPSGFSDLNRVLTVVNHFQIPFGVVINKWNINKSLSNKIEKEFQNQILGKLSYDKRIFEAISNLIPIIKTDLPAKSEIEKIFEEVKSVTGLNKH